jgi:pimeloyl-ACP methyl ester carboxylesterase
VPLDYRQPHGPTISIAVLKHPATDPGRRIGTLFVNGGGPNPQIGSFRQALGGFPAVVRARYDLVTFDPRGFGYSTDIRCFPSAKAEQKFLAGLPAAFPVGAQQDAVWERTWAGFAARCAQRAGPLLDHDTTADVARDLNLLREAVGAPKLDYLGLSYGTLIGATYANLFPATVGRMILDGNVNPVSWTQPEGVLPNWMRLNRDVASDDTLHDFLDLCGQASTSACAFSAGTPAATVAKFGTLLSRLRRHAVTVGAQTYTYAITVASVPVGTVAEWQQGAALLQRLWTASGSGGRPAAAGTVRPRKTAAAMAFSGFSGAYYMSGEEEQLAVVCSDSPNPRDPRLYPLLASLDYARAGGYGPDYVWNSEECAAWPAAAAQDRYSGPWNRRTAGTLLLLGNTGDPNTPYQDSVALSHELASARLLTVDGYGHTEASNPSTCALDYEIRYLLTSALPPVGTVCKQNGKPFPPPGQS